MASVALKFVPPRQENLTTLRILEGTSKDGPFTMIEQVTDIGAYPTYIDNWTTDQATAVDRWFTIQWVDDKGAESDLSMPIQGDTENLVGEVSDRALQRDAVLNETVVVQIAEWVVGKVKKTENPYDATLTASLDELEGMTLLTLARSYLALSGAATASDSYTAGLVSQKSSSGGGSLATTKDLVNWLLAEANKLLGWNWTIVMLLEDFDPTGLGTQSSINWDHSRLALTINYD